MSYFNGLKYVPMFAFNVFIAVFYKSKSFTLLRFIFKSEVKLEV